MNDLNSFDLLGSHKKLKELALKYNALGTLKFGVDVWDFDHMEEIQIKYTCGYLELNGFKNISEAHSADSFDELFSYMENYFINTLPKNDF